MLDTVGNTSGQNLPTERTPLLNPPVRERECNENGNPRNDTHSKTPFREEAPFSRRIIILGSIWIGCFLNAIDSTIVASLAGPISNDFSSFKLLSWLATAFMIGQTALTPLSGRLTDIFGRRAGLVFSNVAFGVGTLICGLATNVWMMILGRAIAGMGGGGLNSISTFIATDLIPLRQRGLWQGASNLLWGVGAGLGGFYGGWIHDTLGWRWAFLIQVPLIFISMVLVMLTVPAIQSDPTDKPKLKRIDFLGSSILITILVLFLLGLAMGGNLLPWSHPIVFTSIACALALLPLFVYVETRVASEPIISIPLLLNRTVASACLTNMFDTMVEYVLHFYGPIFFQTRGFSATQSGTILIPQAIGVAFGSLITGYTMRVMGRYWWLNITLETVKLGSAAVLLFCSSRAGPIWPIYVAYFVAGYCYAGMLTTALVALVAAVDHKDQALVTSASYTFRFMGSALGVSLSSSIFHNVLSSELWHRFHGRPDAKTIIDALRSKMENIQKLPEKWIADALDSYMSAVTGVWAVVVVISVLGLVTCMFMREHQLHSTLRDK
ncbi:putative MFS multidrug transporter [Periconia macrospinosa]|uniref:Putative MFS multidrug transporter n=1 Tax=Periconia macrospinosa TaxID=97972 RepID=A0A2V1DTK5_9PLEO|nr:putative MFS multidrug transporter [Periconia macrospinosa]